MLLDDTGECSARKEGGRHVKIVVSFQEEMKWKEVSWIRFPLYLSLPQLEVPSLVISSSTVFLAHKVIGTTDAFLN